MISLMSPNVSPIMERHVLLVDDSEVETLALKSILEERAYLVTVAQDGLEAMEIIKSSPLEFEIIILDWLMPGIDGVQLCINIRQMNLAINPFIIILTANEWDGVPGILLPEFLLPEICSHIFSFFVELFYHIWLIKIYSC